MRENLEKVKLLACDLRNGKEFPRSPRETLGGYVLAARAVDKCRAVLVGWQGEYHSNCPLDQRWLKFAEIDYHAYGSFVATGATSSSVAPMGRQTPYMLYGGEGRPHAPIMFHTMKTSRRHLRTLI